MVWWVWITLFFTIKITSICLTKETHFGKRYLFVTGLFPDTLVPRLGVFLGGEVIEELWSSGFSFSRELSSVEF